MTRRSERGSAPVEFVLVGVLLVAVAATVLQIGFVAHARAIVADSAIAGAAHAALADTRDEDGIARTRDLIEQSLNPELIRQISLSEGMVEGMPLVDVEVQMFIPLIGPWFPAAAMTVHGRAFREAP